eukprot:m.7799 g.7799  ORF g.7799 m.7799 type:complete len:294 (-) comp3047_c0_seq1:136-1017(-)
MGQSESTPLAPTTPAMEEAALQNLLELIPQRPGHSHGPPADRELTPVVVRVPEDFENLIDAVNDVRDRKTPQQRAIIYIGAGRFAAQPIENIQNLVIVGSGREDTTIISTLRLQTNTSGILMNLSVVASDAIQLVSSDWLLQNVVMQGTSNALWLGGSCTNAHVTMRRCRVGGTADHRATWSIFEYGVDGNTVIMEDCEVCYADSGFTIYKDNIAEVSGSTFHHCTTAMYMQGESRAELDGCELKQNVKCATVATSSHLRATMCTFEDNENDLEEQPNIEIDDLPTKSAGKLI